MGRKRLERKALALAGLAGFAEERWLPPTSPLPLSATQQVCKERDASFESYASSKEKGIGHGAHKCFLATESQHVTSVSAIPK